jgi:hypothetical protein
VRRAGLIGLVALVLALVGCDTGSSLESNGGLFGKPHRDRQCGVLRSEDDAGRCFLAIKLHCGYGAVSRAQLDHCEKSVTLGQIKRLDTSAARFSRLDMSRCLADAGPFCRSTLRQFEADAQADYYGG